MHERYCRKKKEAKINDTFLTFEIRYMVMPVPE